METEQRFEVRVRGVVIDNNEILLVSHAGKEEWLVLPGGHLEWGEDIKSGLERELEEELGIRGQIGSLLYINTFTIDTRHVIEFFFAIDNASDFRRETELTPTHAHELANIVWVPVGTTMQIRPEIIARDVASGQIGKQTKPVFYQAS